MEQNIQLPSKEEEDSSKNPRFKFVRLILHLNTFEIERMIAEKYPNFSPSWEIKSSTRVIFVPFHLSKDKEFRDSLEVLAQLFKDDLKNMKYPDATELLLGKEILGRVRDFQNFII